MSPSFKRGREESLDNGYCLLYSGEAGWDTHYIGIVMGASEGCDFLCPAEGAAHLRVLIDGHSNTVAAAANDDTHLCFALFDSTGNRVPKVGVIYTLGSVGSAIKYLMPLCLKGCYDGLFVGYSGVVITYSNIHFLYGVLNIFAKLINNW